MNRKSASVTSWGVALACVFLCAAGWRVLNWDLMVGMWAHHGVPVSDARALDAWAVDILDGIGFRGRIGYHLYEAFRMPFFSVVLASLYAVFGYHYFPARVVLALLSVTVCLGVAGIGRLLFHRRAGFVAGLLCAFYFPFVQYGAAFMTETLFMFLLVTGVYLFLRSLHERGWGCAVGSGTALGLAAMTRVIALAAVPVMAIYLAAYPTDRGRKARLGLAWIAAVLVSFAPWVVRNAFVFRTFFASESGGIRQVWTGANPRYAPATYTQEAWRELIWRDPDASEMEQNRRALTEARRFIRENPSQYLRWMAWRARQHLRLLSWKEVEGLHNHRCRRIVAASVHVAAWLGYAGFVLALWKRPRSGFLVAGTFLVFVVAHSIAGEYWRYRLTSEWLWLLGASCLVDQVIATFNQGLGRSGPLPDVPVTGSPLDHRLLRWAFFVMLALPFAALAVSVPVHLVQRSREKLPALPRDAANLIREQGLASAFAAQGNLLRDVSYYRNLARGQNWNAIWYPPHVVLWAGEASYFEHAEDGQLERFMLEVNKAGSYAGDARVFCHVDRKSGLRVPPGTRRRPCIVLGVISDSGGLGEPSVRVSDILVGGRSLKRGER